LSAVVVVVELVVQTVEQVEEEEDTQKLIVPALRLLSLAVVVAAVAPTTHLLPMLVLEVQVVARVGRPVLHLVLLVAVEQELKSQLVLQDLAEETRVPLGVQNLAVMVLMVAPELVPTDRQITVDQTVVLTAVR
jgi:hypothetical protein